MTEERRDRQAYANWRVQEFQRLCGGKLTFAQVLGEFRQAGADYDAGARRVVEDAAA
jgi:hypothetical protein